MSDQNDYFQPKPDLWQWRDLQTALEIQANTTQAQRASISRIVTDSRKIEAGDLFVALSGDPGVRFNPSSRSAVDGHSFVSQAVSKGALGAMVRHDFVAPEGVEEDQLLRVADTYDGLWALGKAARARMNGVVIAVTGSSGKTTAKTFLQYALQAYAPPGSFNNHIGVPLTLTNAPPNQAFYVLEIGTNHPGEIEPLAKMVNPDWAMVLNVQQAHIENFENWDALKEEKLSIFKALEDSSNSIYEDILGLTCGHGFGSGEQAEARLLDVEGHKASIALNSHQLTIQVPGGGWHRATTATAAVLLTTLVGGDVSRATALPEDLIPAGRGRTHQLGTCLVIDESYNANPDSMRAALATGLERGVAGQRVAVIGEMGELGDYSAQAHDSLYELLAAYDLVFCVGAGTQGLAERLGCHWQAQADSELLERLRQQVSPESMIVVKGSNRVFWSIGFVPDLLRALADD
ncbi:MAG: UDP-N-acetylmuramoyl-tripeptide--D-alanyl-D-alanine ligase [Pseudomonadota bacterium]